MTLNLLYGQTRATHRYGTPVLKMPTNEKPLVCPFCGTETATWAGNIKAHTMPGVFFECAATGLTPAKAATIDIDDQGRLIGVDEMAYG